MKALWGLLLSILCFGATAATNSYPERSKVLQNLTNPPSTFRVVFDYWTPRGMVNGIYEVESQPWHWKAKLKRHNDKQFEITGGSTPDQNWLVRHGVVDSWIPRKKVLPGDALRRKTHQELISAMPLAHKVLNLGIIATEPSLNVTGNTFKAENETGFVRKVSGTFLRTLPGALRGATLEILLQDGSKRNYDIRYVFKPEKFEGAFPALIEIWENDSALVEKFEIVEYQPNVAIQPPGAFQLNGKGEPQRL